MKHWNSVAAFGIATLPVLATAQSCSGPSPSGSIQTSIASGYQVQVVATGLSDPRGIALDGTGHLLVVEQGRGVVSAHTLDEANGCVSVTSSLDVTSDLSVGDLDLTFPKILMVAAQSRHCSVTRRQNPLRFLDRRCLLVEL